MAKTLRSQCRDLGSIPGWGNDICYALKTQRRQINNVKEKRRLRDLERLIKYLPQVRQLEEVGLNFKTRSVCLSQSYALNTTLHCLMQCMQERKLSRMMCYIESSWMQGPSVPPLLSLPRVMLSFLLHV